MSEYLEFERAQEAETGKTQVWRVLSKRTGLELGRIRWMSSWRQYVFDPEWETTFNRTCMLDVVDFIQQLMDDRNAKV